MATSTVQLRFVDVGKTWKKACLKGASALNKLFVANGINVSVSESAAGPAYIEVSEDQNLRAGVYGLARNGKWLSGPLQLESYEIGLKADTKIGPGVRQAVFAHELCHALGHTSGVGGLDHSTHLMTAVNTYKNDKLVAGPHKMPPLKLSEESIDLLKTLWP